MNPGEMEAMFPRMPLGGKDQEALLVMASAAQTVKIMMEWEGVGVWMGVVQWVPSLCGQDTWLFSKSQWRCFLYVWDKL